jgi:membrane protein YdbS with pleckstrin-like domain
MAFPKRLLIPGEEIVVELRPHLAALTIPSAILAAVTIAAIWAFSSFHVTFVRWSLFAVWVGTLSFVFLPKLIWWLTSDFVVTTSRVVHRQGFIAKKSMEIPLGKINDVRFEQGMVDRLVGAGTLIIQSASEAGREEFEFVRHPEEVQKTIYEQTERTQRSVGSDRPPPPPSPPAPPSPVGPPGAAPNVTTELERLADLRSRGVLTEEEFRAQKARILGE